MIISRRMAIAVLSTVLSALIVVVLTLVVGLNTTPNSQPANPLASVQTPELSPTATPSAIPPATDTPTPDETPSPNIKFENGKLTFGKLRLRLPDGWREEEQGASSIALGHSKGEWLTIAQIPADTSAELSSIRCDNNSRPTVQHRQVRLGGVAAHRIDRSCPGQPRWSIWWVPSEHLLIQTAEGGEWFVIQSRWN